MRYAHNTDSTLYIFSFILGLHTTILQADIYTVIACIMENIEKGYICILADSQGTIKALDCSR